MDWSCKAALCRSVLAVLTVVAPYSLAPQVARAQDAATESQDTLIVRGMHRQLRFDTDVSRVAVGDATVLSAEVLTSKSILLLGLETGRTSLLVWHDEENVETFVVAVQPDLDVLRRALLEIHPNITVEMAPDRDAVVLRGVVPDAEYSRAAAAAAATYIQAGRTNAGDVPLVRARTADEANAVSESAVRAEHDVRGKAPVINLLRVQTLPETLDNRLRRAVAETGGIDVRIRRLVRGDYPNDEQDVFVLEGTVPDQIALTRVLFVARTLVSTDSSGDLGEDIEVGADESGAVRNSGTSRSGSGSGRGGNSSSSGSLGGTSGSSGDLDNDIDTNVGRAKVLSLASGRILSFVEVRDLPQVRVDVRIYEVDRAKLLEYAPELTVIGSDFDQASLLASAEAFGVQGAEAARIGGIGQEDVQGVLSFLTGGASSAIQVSGRHYAIDATLKLLETRGLARSLANPSLTVLSGENANFQVGGQIPVPQSFAPAGVDSPDGVFSAVEFRNFGVELGVRPLVGADGRLTIDVFSQVDRPSADLTTLVRETTGADQQTTSFESRTLQTSARLADGQSLVMAGLISRSDNNSASYTPGLHSVPLVGWLFKRFSIEEQAQEIVVVINPTIVRDPLDGLATWAFPDVSGELRGWVDRMLEHNGVSLRCGAAAADSGGAAARTEDGREGTE